MSEFTNGLTPAQVERLALLVEECGEVAHIVGKVLRHGYESYNPVRGDGRTNRRMLEQEVGDLLQVLGMLLDAEDISHREVAVWQASKGARMRRWLHHQPDPPASPVVEAAATEGGQG